MFLYGIGIGLATAQLTGVIMVDVPMTSTGQASGSQSTVRQVGSALGVAVLGTLLFTGTQASMEQRLSDLEVPREQSIVLVDAVVDSAGSVIPELTDGLIAQQVPQELAEEITAAAGEAFTDGAKWAAWSAAGFLLLGFASTFYLGSQKTKTKRKSAKKG
ncbi:unannotated protein [freshwater metagenome]|uniref:Unannotated protein n=1 Tax=freshwater metagenome TaxID=449393 RepID=A0A6J6CLQ5_9ZZZZ